MRTRINHVQVFQAHVSAVRDWKIAKKVAMNRVNVKRCARDLKISGSAVRDAMNVAKIRYSF